MSLHFLGGVPIQYFGIDPRSSFFLRSLRRTISSVVGSGQGGDNIGVDVEESGVRLRLSIRGLLAVDTGLSGSIGGRVVGGDLGDGVGQGSIVVYAGGQSVGVDESRVSLGISGPLSMSTHPGIDIF